MTFIKSIKRYISRPTFWGYEVKSGPWPLYRELVILTFIGALVQLYYGPSDSLKKGLPTWYIYPFLSMVLVGCVCIITAIVFMRPTLNSLPLERSGCLLLAGSAVIYFINFFYTSGIPKTFQTYIMFILVIYPIQRVFEIRQEREGTKNTLKIRGYDE